MTARTLTGRTQHRAMVVGATTHHPGYVVLVLQVEENYDLNDDYGTRQQWRDARTEDLAHLRKLYVTNGE